MSKITPPPALTRAEIAPIATKTEDSLAGLQWEGRPMNFVALMAGRKDRHEIARRLAACWNACEGLSTEALELEPYIGGASYLMRQRAEAQRDELLEALCKCRDMVGHPDNIAMIDEAIAKATGQKGENL